MRVPATRLTTITLTATSIRITPGAAASLALAAMGKAKIPLVMDSHPPRRGRGRWRPPAATS